MRQKCTDAWQRVGGVLNTGGPYWRACTQKAAVNMGWSVVETRSREREGRRERLDNVFCGVGPKRRCHIISPYLVVEERWLIGQLGVTEVWRQKRFWSVIIIEAKRTKCGVRKDSTRGGRIGQVLRQSPFVKLCLSRYSARKNRGSDLFLVAIMDKIPAGKIKGARLCKGRKEPSSECNLFLLKPLFLRELYFRGKNLFYFWWWSKERAVELNTALFPVE